MTSPGGAFALYSLLKRQGTVLQNKPATQLDAQARYLAGGRSLLTPCRCCLSGLMCSKASLQLKLQSLERL